MNSRLEAFFTVVSHTISALVVVLFIGGVTLAEPLTAKTITIRMLNGKSGKPLSHNNVTLVWSPDFSPPGSVVYVAKDGIGTVEIPPGAELFRMIGGPKVGKEPYRIPFINCNAAMTEKVHIVQVLENGYVPGNVCSKKSAVARPGEIVFWAMPKRWWQPDMQ